MMPDHDLRNIDALLDFYAASGVDAGLDEAAHDRFAESAAEAQARAGRQPVADRGAEARPIAAPAANPALAASAEDQALVARSAARAAATLEELRAVMEAFEGCALRLTAKSLCFADGNPAARIMFVGEAPGGDEDRVGRPFVGRSGQLLDRMLKAIGLDRNLAYIANIVPWRPPGNRTPTPQEAAICRPFIERQIELCDPDILVCLGGPSAQALLGSRDGIIKTRGRWFEYATGSRTIRAMATLHPAYLLREPRQKRLAWRDMKALKAALENPPPS